MISGKTAENLGLIARLSSLAGVQSVDDGSVPPELRDFLDIIGTSGTRPGVY